jgi:D-alanine-D-alanine ligase
MLRDMALRAYQALDLKDLSRVDFFQDKVSGQFYINEVNTLPGFTSMSLYPKLWAASGLSYSQLLDQLIELALQSYEIRQQLRSYR